ncbi:phosphatase PAP2 family protein [Actinomyces sp. HMT897]|uniref:phosphatase PAP2 family protein n=1 Tax=Actinomyces sp. HMT897 TaxID=2789424 RepID=UPI00190A1DE4|nr:phosphatase PAP2 family protein [Actinomyces sp. HMT897]QQO78045.1 phosphatase PAP2 family protein [Actinomyces sp. HMT897]
MTAPTTPTGSVHAPQDAVPDEAWQHRASPRCHHTLAHHAGALPGRAPLLTGAALAVIVFCVLALGVVTGTGLTNLDPTVTGWAVHARTRPVSAVATFLSTMASTPGLTALTVLTALLLAWRGYRQHAGVLLVAMIGSSTLTVLVKDAWERGRPSTTLLLGKPASSFSFPSGHSLNSTVFLGVLAGFVLVSGACQAYKSVALGTALLVAAGVGLSRVYLGYHWMTDVLAGWSLGLAWTFAMVLVLEGVVRWQQRRAPALPPARGQGVAATAPAETAYWS